MAETPSKTPSRPQEVTREREWWPLSTLRREIDRLFDDFHLGSRRTPSSVFDIEPFRRVELTFGKAPAVDISEKEKEYEITAELPSMEEKDIDVKFANGMLTIKGKKRKRKKRRRRRITISPSAATDHSTAPLPCPKTLTPTRSTRASRTAC